MPQARSVITLLTDFGDRDHFVASMKGVILSIHPDARLVDLSHQVTPYHIHEAAYLLRSCYRYFPEGTIHVSVVDPGVGTTRRPLLASTSRYCFLAPDNGLLSYVLKEEEQAELRQIENPRYRLQPKGPTFDGRDVFAPAAAWLAKGEPLASFGRAVTDPVQLELGEAVQNASGVRGRVVHVDRFGNLITNVTAEQISKIRSAGGRADVTIRLGQHIVNGMRPSYSAGEVGRPCALINSNGFLELFLKEGNAAERLGVRVGATVEIS